MRVDLSGRRVLVTGASRGIGAAIAQRMAEAGAAVTGLSRSGTGEGDAVGVTHRRVDVTDEAALASAIEQIAGDGLDICVVNAGAVLVEDFHATPTADWRALIEVNLVAALTTTRLALRSMLSAGAGGRIVVVSSAVGVRAEPDVPVYCATKAALHGLVQALAIKYAEHGITVNAIAPGEIDTRLNSDAAAEVARRRETTLDALRAELVDAHIPVQRLGEPDDIAGLAVFLAGPQASFITGQVLVVDGGQVLV